MAFSYSDDAPTDVHKVRLLIADTTKDDGDGRQVYVFEDEELTTFLGMVGQSLYGAAAMALRSRLVDLAKAYTYKLGRAQGGVEVSTKDAIAILMKLAADYETKSADTSDPEYVDWSLSQLDDLDARTNRVWDTDAEERSNAELSN